MLRIYLIYLVSPVLCASLGSFLLNRYTSFISVEWPAGLLFFIALCALLNGAYSIRAGKNDFTGLLIAGIVITPIGLRSASVTLLDPVLLLAGAGVGVCSSVIPYICDQFAMARLSKATFALMLSLLPATACLVGLIVLRQVPSLYELTGVGAVIAGVALKRSAND